MGSHAVLEQQLEFHSSKATCKTQSMAGVGSPCPHLAQAGPTALDPRPDFQLQPCSLKLISPLPEPCLTLKRAAAVPTDLMEVWWPSSLAFGWWPRAPQKSNISHISYMHVPLYQRTWTPDKWGCELLPDEAPFVLLLCRWQTGVLRKQFSMARENLCPEPPLNSQLLFYSSWHEIWIFCG